MVKKLTALLGVYEEEIQLFLWTMVLLFIVRSGATILTNYGDAVFLKRYGVEYLPIVNMMNAVATVVVMGFVAGVMQQMSGSALLIRMFLASGITMAVIRALIPLEVDLIYPLLFMLKAQFEVILALLFWNLANDLFNTQQAKRLFPLLTAGGVVGQILASFGTPWFARTLSFDNILLAYFLLCLGGAATVYFMALRFPMLLSGGGKKTKGPKKKASMMAEMRQVWPMVKDSTLVKIMVLLTFVPNVVIPILNYQFNYAVNEQFTSEEALLEFFGYMRGVLNIISLVLLLFVGKIFGRWGLPVALMFHPFNYILAFLSFLFRFDVFSALYARMSTQILRTSINAPATAVLSGLFPASYRAMVRPFLRGTVVRIGLFIGSTLILISDSLFHPRYLSFVALPFIFVWLTVPFWLKRRYTDILTDLVAGDMSDIKSMEAEDIQHLFRDPAMREKLRADFIRTGPEESLWFGQLLKTVNDTQLDRLVLDKLDNETSKIDAQVQIQLMELLSKVDDASAVEVLGKIAINQAPEQQVAAISTLVRLAPVALRDQVDLASLINTSSPEVRGQAAAALLPSDPNHYRTLIQAWIDSEDHDVRLAGVIAAGASGDPAFVASLAAQLQRESHSRPRAAVLEALRQIDPPELNLLAEPDLLHKSPEVREAAIAALRISDKASLKKIIPLLGDSSLAVIQQAKAQIIAAPYQDGKQLIRALSTPRRQVREEIFKILDLLDIKDLDVVRFVRDQTEGAYKYLFEAQAASTLRECPERDLLQQHLRQQGQLQVENIIRVLATQDTSGKMRIVSRGLLSADARQKANSEEALADLLDKAIARIIIPLIDASPLDQKLAAGKKYFKLNPFEGGPADFIQHLLASKIWVTRALALETAAACEISGVDPGRLAAAGADGENEYVRRAAQRLERQRKDEANNEETNMAGPIAISEQILLLKRIDIFAGLSITELSAIAAITEQVDHEPEARVINQGDSGGDTLYLIISGRVAVLKYRDDGTEMELDQMTSGDYFGEMSLFENAKRSASIVTREDTRLLFLHKQDFTDMVREYPQIALAICNALSGRIRKLHEKMQA